MTTIILAPEYFGGLRMYWRTDRGPLRHGPVLVHPFEVRSCLLNLPAPRTVVLCGRRYADQVSLAVLDDADLFIVPNTWLRHLPPFDCEDRAAHGARVAAAHARAPVEHRVGRVRDLPF
ncbi:MAG: hypothetical protein HZA54_11460 [Planctomycetes bacterium]|nr:hypothetical protein [Planctomycetota bacterium]